MEQNLRWSWFDTWESKHSNENKVSLVFRHLIFCSIFVSLLNLVYFNYYYFLLILYFCKFTSKIILFQEALQFKATIILCYNQQTIMKVIGRVPPPLTWHISQIIVDFLFSIISAYVLNQSHGHWLFFNALNVIITMSLKFKEQYKNSLNL